MANPRQTKPERPPATWLLLRPSSRPGDEDGYCALRLLLKRLLRVYSIKLVDIRPEHSEAVPKPPEKPLANPDASQHQSG